MHMGFCIDEDVRGVDLRVLGRGRGLQNPR